MQKILNIDEYMQLLKYLFEKIQKEITLANRIGELNQVLEKYGCEDFFEEKNESKGLIDDSEKILVVGGLNVSRNDIKKLFKENGIKEENVDICDYSEAKSINSKIVNRQYKSIFVGSVPHKTKNIGKNRSCVSKFESSELENVLRVGTNSLKITKSALLKSISKEQLQLR